MEFIAQWYVGQDKQSWCHLIKEVWSQWEDKENVSLARDIWCGNLLFKRLWAAQDKDCVVGVDTFQGLVLPLFIILDIFEQLDDLSVHTSCCSYHCLGLGQTHLASTTSPTPETHTVLPFTFCFRHSLLPEHVVDLPVGTYWALSQVQSQSAGVCISGDTLNLWEEDSQKMSY